MADTNLRDDFNSSYLNRDRDVGIELPNQFALSKYVDSLEAAFKQLNKMNLSNEEKIAALKKIEQEREKNYSKLNFKQR